MKSKTAIGLSCMSCVLLCFGAANARGGDSLRFPGATLLLGYGYVNYLVLTTPTEKVRVLPAADQPETRSYPSPVFPSISRNGNLVACARLKTISPQRTAIATYSVADKKWVEYVDVSTVWAIGISPDNKKLAYISNDREHDPALLHVLDMETHLTNVLPARVSVPSTLSWAPNSERITYQADSSQTELDRVQRQVNVADLKTGKVWAIGTGKHPSWSPSGEWIAYLDPSGNRAMLAHPDGSGTKTLTTAPANLWGVRGQFFLSLVWSPDSDKLVLNELWDPDTLQTDVLLVNADNGKLERKFSKRTAVLGWAEAK